MPAFRIKNNTIMLCSSMSLPLAIQYIDKHDWTGFDLLAIVALCSFTFRSSCYQLGILDITILYAHKYYAPPRNSKFRGCKCYTDDSSRYLLQSNDALFLSRVWLSFFVQFTFHYTVILTMRHGIRRNWIH